MNQLNSDDFLSKLESKLQNPVIDLSTLTAEEQCERILNRVASIPNAVITPADLLERLKLSKKNNKPLSIKFGIDPTGPEIHIGHAVSLINLRLFQRMGHKIQLVIGDFTGMIGDPSGRSDDRPPLTEEQVQKNMETYTHQAARIIDLKASSVETFYNSKWMKTLSVADWVKIIRYIPVSSLLQREDFAKRISSGHGLSIAEMEYALFMAYDSVVLQPDLEMGGMDQYLNLHMCRQLMEVCKQKPEIVITYNLLPGTSGERSEDGRFSKMSKSRGNYIPVTATPEDMYGKTMSIPDEVMWIWYRELTEILPEDLLVLKDSVTSGKIHPKSAKQLLARTVVGIFNFFDQTIIKRAELDFNEKFGKQASLNPTGSVPVMVSEGQILVDVLAQAAEMSKGEIRRLVKQRGIRFFHGETSEELSDTHLQNVASMFDGYHVRIGKKIFLKLTKN